MSQLKNYLTSKELEFLEKNRSVIDSYNLQALNNLLESELTSYKRARILLALFYIGGFDALRLVSIERDYLKEVSLYLDLGEESLVLANLMLELPTPIKDRVELFFKKDLDLPDDWAKIFLDKIKEEDSVKLPEGMAKILKPKPLDPGSTGSDYLDYMEEFSKIILSSSKASGKAKDLLKTYKNMWEALKDRY
jgi:hypothetical protein